MANKMKPAITFTIWNDQAERLENERKQTGTVASRTVRTALDKLWQIRRDAQGNPVAKGGGK